MLYSEFVPTENFTLSTNDQVVFVDNINRRWSLHQYDMYILLVHVHELAGSYCKLLSQKACNSLRKLDFLSLSDTAYLLEFLYFLRKLSYHLKDFAVHK